MENLSIPIERLDDSVKVPSYAHIGDSGLDLQSTIDTTLAPLERKLIPCGFALAIPEGYGGFVLPRSGLAIHHGISIVNSPGLIDSNYRGEIKVILINHDPHNEFKIERGDRIAQLVIMATPFVTLKQVASLDDTDRGSKGFGSSGLEG